MTDVLGKTKAKDIFGGELPLKRSEEKSFFVDSGRSSLRLFVRSHKDLRFAVPDYLCSVVVQVLQGEGASFFFYKVREDLTVDWNQLEATSFEVLYVIDYFGQDRTPLPPPLREKIVLEDQVFRLELRNRENLPSWYSFNSYRKVSALAEGSQIKTNLNICFEGIAEGDAPFSVFKYQAKALKNDYVFSGAGDESSYLQLFKAGEECLDQQREIYGLSAKGMALLLDETRGFSRELERRRENMQILHDVLGAWAVLTQVQEPSFFVLKSPRRDELKKYLATQQVFLPIHWPEFGPSNKLYHELISIPVFGFYSAEEMRSLAKVIKDFYNERH